MRPAKLLPILLAPLAVVGGPAFAIELGASGHPSGNSFSLGAFAGGHVFAQGSGLGVAGGPQNSDGAGNAAMGGLRASVGLSRWFVAEAELAGLATQDRVYQRSARVLGYRINALATLARGDFRPFVLVGAGAMQVASTDAQGSAGLTPDTKAEVHTGIGFDYRVLDRVSVRGDARVLQVPSKESWALTTDVEAMLGAFVSFGAGRAPSPGPDASGQPAAADVSGPAAPAVPVIVAGLPEDKPAASVNAESPPSESAAWPMAAEPARAQAMPAESSTVAAASGAPTIGELLGRAREIKFEPGTTKLNDSSLSFLTDLAAALLKEPAAKLEITVHTADNGDPKKDLALSRRRAEVVKRALVDKGASTDQLVAVGRGSEDPVAPNLTRTGRMRNERVELHRALAPAHGP